MPRIRTIKPEMFQDEKLAPLSVIDRLVFIGLISMADDAGRLLDNAKVIDAFIFPDTDDTARGSLDILASVGVITRGVTESGQRVVQIVNWSAHQKIDRPNFASCLPPIAGPPPPAAEPRAVAEASTNLRRKLAEATREAVWNRYEGRCAFCAVPCKKDKADKYDSDPTLGEIDHILALADGGSDDPQNLQLLCLSCNRKKAGEAVRRRVADGSPNDRRTVGDGAPNHTYDLRSTTNDLRPTTNDQEPHHNAREAFLAGLNGKATAWRARLVAWERGGMHSLDATAAEIDKALEEYALNGYPRASPNSKHIEAMVRSVVADRARAAAHPIFEGTRLNGRMTVGEQGYRNAQKAMDNLGVKYDEEEPP